MPVEGRTLGRYDLGRETEMSSTETQISTDTKLKRIAWLSSKDPHKVFGQLVHHFNEESLRACFKELQPNKARGIDGVSKIQYGENLDTNLQELVQKMKTMSYRMGPVRQVEISKGNGKGVHVFFSFPLYFYLTNCPL
jgi:hypothetical protein